MTLSFSHDATIEQLIEAHRNSDTQTVLDITGESQMAFHEAIYIIAATCNDETVDCFHFSRQLFDLAGGFQSEGERLAKGVLLGNVADVVRELSARSRQVAFCLVAIACDVDRTVAASVMNQMNFIHDNPDVIGQEWV